MADNPYKRAIANRALSILVAGRTGQAGVFFNKIDDTEFANYTTVSEANEPDKRIICALYESVLKQVIEDIAPDFAKRYDDLGRPMAVNSQYGGWDFLFELPSDYLALVAQVSEGKPDQGHKCDVLTFTGYSHVVCGTDGQAYSCKLNHISSDASQPTTGTSYSTYWTLYNADGSLGAEWASGVSYKYNSNGKLLATNTLSNADGDSAYIRYLAYVQGGFADRPQDYPESFKNAQATRLAAEIALDSKDYERRRRLLEEYESLAKPAYWQVQQRHTGQTKHTTIFEARTKF